MTSEMSERIETEREAREYLMEHLPGLDTSFDHRSMVELAELHQRTGSTALQQTVNDEQPHLEQ